MYRRSCIVGCRCQADGVYTINLRHLDAYETLWRFATILMLKCSGRSLTLPGLMPVRISKSQD